MWICLQAVHDLDNASEMPNMSEGMEHDIVDAHEHEGEHDYDYGHSDRIFLLEESGKRVAPVHPPLKMPLIF